MIRGPEINVFGGIDQVFSLSALIDVEELIDNVPFSSSSKRDFRGQPNVEVYVILPRFTRRIAVGQKVLAQFFKAK